MPYRAPHCAPFRKKKQETISGGMPATSTISGDVLENQHIWGCTRKRTRFWKVCSKTSSNTVSMLENEHNFGRCARKRAQFEEMCSKTRAFGVCSKTNPILGVVLENEHIFGAGVLENEHNFWAGPSFATLPRASACGALAPAAR